MRISQSRTFWQGETNYICSLDPANPGGNFNHDSAVFARYCSMQANSARRDGFGDLADKIERVNCSALVAANAGKMDV